MDKLGKILIVDDNEDVLFALNLLLEPLAEKVKVAGRRASMRSGKSCASTRRQWSSS